MKPDRYLCPGCDQEVVVGSSGCPRCQPRPKRAKRSKATAPRTKRSWHQESGADGLNLPGEDFDYEDFVAREFGRKPHRRVGIKWYWWLTALILVILMIIGSGVLSGW